MALPLAHRGISLLGGLIHESIGAYEIRGSLLVTVIFPPPGGAGTDVVVAGEGIVEVGEGAVDIKEVDEREVDEREVGVACWVQLITPV